MALTRMGAAGRVERDRRSADPAALDYRDIALDSVAHGFCVFAPDLTIRLANARMREIFGMSEDVIRVGAPMRGLLVYSASRGRLGNKTIEEAWAERLALLAKGEPFSRIEEFADGRVVSIRYQPAAHGCWVGIHHDITAQHRLEQELRAQASIFEEALENMSHALAVFDVDQRLVIFNSRYITMYGYDPAIVRRGAHLRQVQAHGIERGIYAGMTLEQLQEDSRRVIASGSEVSKRRQLLDGRWIETRSRPMPGGGWVFTAEDVTERETFIQELNEQHQRFDAALNAMSQALCMFDADQRLIVCNENYVTLFGADPAVVKPGITLRDIFAHGVQLGSYPGMSADELVARRLEAIARSDGRSYDQEMTDGRIIAVSIETMANGGWLGMFEDVTEIRRAEVERARALAEVQQQNLLLDATLESMAQGLCVYDRHMRVVVRNRRYLDIYRLEEDDVRPGMTMVEVIERSVARGVHTNGRTAQDIADEFMSMVEAHRGYALTRHLADGRILNIRVQPMTDGGWLATFEDVTARERATLELSEQHRRFNVALNNMAHGLAMLDENLNLIVCNRRYLDMYGMSADVVRPRIAMLDIVRHSIAQGNYAKAGPEELVADYLDSLRRGEYLSHRHLSGDRIYKVLYQPMPHGGWVAVHEDVTERHKVEQHIVHLAHHDALTGLPNRTLFRERLAEGLAALSTSDGSLALLCLDLDHFKSVNDTLGHPVGDEMLSVVARRLEQAVGDAGTIARLGGDEFAILLSGRDGTPGGAECMARRLGQTLSEPLVIEGHVINTSMSMGIAIALRDAGSGDQLMKCADLALYRAKAEGRSTYRFYEADMSRSMEARRELELDLREALAAQEFHLVFQPQVDSTGLKLAGFEALVRWTHALRGPVPPNDFIPIAEETGLIVPLGRWVLEAACRQAVTWPTSVPVAINLSPVQFKDRQLVDMVRRVLAETGLAPGRLELEITEAVLLQNDDVTMAMLHDLRALGVRIAMDDFGVGYSSLSYLRRFRFDKIKIDRSFIADLDRGADNAAIVRAMAQLGRSLGIDTTAEGVESEEQLAIVRACGCSHVQGYLVSPPRGTMDVSGLIDRFQG
ncbi:PAS-domain containing protein [Phreatobacter sp.]|uniref:PAS-domain containing protein n=1 Tax=Phreatobacter sp. TaxID=1966341 RepID=UPI0022C50B9C|nr:PAS-domain containing protein [Phreatobacter sp.]MCZ8313284.1 PAS-domain containing protein [Phreatobacter sp.]